MRGRRGGRVGIPIGPAVGQASGVFHVGEVLPYKKSGGWPVVTSGIPDGNARIAPVFLISPTPHIRFEQVKVNGGTLS